MSLRRTVKRAHLHHRTPAVAGQRVRVEHHPAPIYASRGTNPPRLVGYTCECGTIMTPGYSVSLPLGRTGRPARKHGERLNPTGVGKRGRK